MKHLKNDCSFIVSLGARKNYSKLMMPFGEKRKVDFKPVVRGVTLSRNAIEN